jgi:SAM-dependent methyltransferase
MQRARWINEYTKHHNLPAQYGEVPSRALSNFLSTHQLTPSEKAPQALDVGCGLGRNSRELARHGYEVVGIDIVPSAIEEARAITAAAELDTVCVFTELSSGDPLPFAPRAFDLVIDMMTLHSLNAEERAIYAGELLRVMKPGATFLLHTLATDPASTELIASNPGPEDGSYVLPETDMVEKVFTKEELLALFAGLECVSLKPQTRETTAFGSTFTRTYWIGGFRQT